MTGGPAKEEALAELAAAVRASGLLEPGASVVVMVSGGADSACLAAGLARELGADAVHALHVNYGLRDGAGEAEAACRRLCAALRIDLHVERPRAPLAGNLQAGARELRYDAAERLRARTGSGLIATGHTSSDVAETLLYRLAVSPGSRALLGLAPRSGRIVRPLIALDRERVRALARAAGLPFSDDETNDELRFARNRIRHEVLPMLEQRFDRNLRATLARSAENVRADAEHLDALASEAAVGVVDVRDEDIRLDATALAALPRPVAARVVQQAIRLAAVLAGAWEPDAGAAHILAVLDLAAGRPGRRVDLPGDLVAERRKEYVRVSRPSPETHEGEP